ncbi:DNA replication complex GINS protein SLD5-like [Neltuma alba]|nr:DNA replication complex GINS protein SLD5-like [Prosopis alba]
MDLDRAQFLLRSYLRVRIQKIEKFVFHIAKTDELWNKLSKEEKNFARRCTEDLKQHLEDSVLSKLPENYQSFQKQSVISEEDDMIMRRISWDIFALPQKSVYRIWWNWILAVENNIHIPEAKNISQASSLRMDQWMTGRCCLRWSQVCSTSYVTSL